MDMDTRVTRDRGSITAAALWMFVLSVLLFWLPLIGPLIAGFVGGQKAGSPGAAIVAGLIPAVAVALLLLLVGSLFALPIIGFLVGAGIFLIIAVQSIPLLIGAFLGGVLSGRRT